MSPVTLYLAPDGDTPHEDPLDAVDEQLPLSGHDDGETVTVEEWAHVATLTYEARGMEFVLRSRVEHDSHPVAQQESSPPVEGGASPGGDTAAEQVIRRIVGWMEAMGAQDGPYVDGFRVDDAREVADDLRDCVPLQPLTIADIADLLGVES